MINQEILKEHLEYKDGHLFWIKPGYGVSVGRQFGSYNNDGYRVGQLKDKGYREHRLIWLYHYGEWPKDQIDHINGIKDDNRIENLRECTAQQNSFNKKSKKGSTSNYKGVHWSKRGNKWIARYWHNGKRHYLGLFETELEAAAAYDKAVEHLHGEYQVKNI